MPLIPFIAQLLKRHELDTDEDRRIDELLSKALNSGSDADYDAVVNAGPGSVARFRKWMCGGRNLRFDKGIGRDLFDNENHLGTVLGGNFPQAFLDAFNSTAWKRRSPILLGLGATHSEAAKPTLFSVLERSGSEFRRIDAAIAIGDLPGPDSVAVLLRAARRDSSFLVKYHSIRSLGRIADDTVLDEIRAISHRTLNRAVQDACDEATKMLMQRGAGPDNQDRKN